MPTATSTRTKLVVESAEAVLGLHWFIARDHTAAEEGLEIEIITPGIKTKFDWTDPRSRDHHLVTSTNYQKAFEQGKCDVYRACEWGQIRRTYDNPRGPIVARRPTMVYQGIFVRPDSPINAPINLAGKSVGVQFHQGSHYSSLAMLEGFLRRDEIRVVHAGMVQERYEALMNGEVEAATLMEPWVTLAHKNGCKEVVATFYQGTENAREDMDREVWEAALRAVRKAVRLFNADKKKHIHHMLEEIPEKYAKQLTLDDFYLPRLRYVDPAPYTRDEFERAYNWMLTWDLVGANANYEGLVCNKI
ncbi:MAG: ABC transporter substrate-binding protein [Betaproteobacteria bacterium]